MVPTELQALEEIVEELKSRYEMGSESGGRISESKSSRK